MYRDFSVRRWLTTTNHKDIGILYLITSLYFLVLAGFLAGSMRTQLAFPDLGLLDLSKYVQAVSLHGLLMILWFLSPLGVALANYLVPLQIGAKDLAFPRLNAVSYWLYLFSGLMVVSTLFMPGGAPYTGWTLYAPLATNQYTPQPGMTIVLIALALLAASVTISSVNFITTIAWCRAKGVKWRELPVFTWGVLGTVALMLYAFPVLGVGVILLTTDRVLGSVFFSSVQGGGMLWDTIFWFFGHPEVYIVILPALGILAEVIPTFTRRPLFGKQIWVVELGIVVALSIFVWGHHMFVTGINYATRTTFMLTTFAISVPFEAVVIGLVLSLRKGSTRISVPLLYVLGSLFFIIIGGITGVFLASIPLDYALRGTYFVVGHFHYIMVGGTIFGLFAGLFYWFPKMTGRMFNERLAKWLFGVSFLGFNILYFPMFLLSDMPRRIATYPLNPEWIPLNEIATIGAYIWAPAALLALLNLAYSLFRGRRVEMNVWGSKAPEWAKENEPAKRVQAGKKGRDGGDGELTSLPIIASFLAITFGYGVVFSPIIVILATGGLVITTIYWFRDHIMQRFSSIGEKAAENWPFTSLTKEKLGVWVFLASEMVVFGAMIGGYLYVRVNSASWPVATETHNLLLGTVNTIILLTSSLAMILALQSAKAGNRRGLIAGLSSTIVLGLMFLLVKLGFEWPGLLSKGFNLSSGLPADTYFVLTGAHAVHVAIGLFAVSYLLVKALKGGFSADKHSGVENVGIYWHFVDIVWMLLFPLFYLI